MYAANYNALLPELFPDEHRRAGANSLRQAFQLLAFAIALAATPVLTTSVFGSPDSPEGFRITAILYAVLAVTALLFMALNVREDPARAREDHAGLLTGARTILRSPHFWLVGLATACYLVPLAFVLAGVQLYVKYSLGLPVANSLWLIGSSIVIAAGGLPLWTALVRRHGAPLAWRCAFAVLAAGFVPFYLATTLAGAIAGLGVVAVGWSGLLATNDLIQARVLDDDVRRHGQHREGLFLSAFGFFSRLAGMTAGIGLGSLGLFFGYYSGENPGPDPGTAFRVAVSVYPSPWPCSAWCSVSSSGSQRPASRTRPRRHRPPSPEGPRSPVPAGPAGPDQVADAAAMLAMDASSRASNSSSVCWAVSPSVSAREKLATTPWLRARRSFASSRL